jgi:plasmid stabilization system protein ParE
MRIKVLDQAAEDLIEGFHFYEDQQAVLGSYFLANLHADIESLRLYGGMHRQVFHRYHRLLSRRFPFAVFYKVHDETAFIYAVIDCRRDPAWIRRRLK